MTDKQLESEFPTLVAMGFRWFNLRRQSNLPLNSDLYNPFLSFTNAFKAFRLGADKAEDSLHEHNQIFS